MTDKSIHKIPDFKIPDGWRLVSYGDLPKGTMYSTDGNVLIKKYGEGSNRSFVLIPDIQPAPKGFTLDRWFLPGDADAGDVIHITTVGEMRNRIDLDQWEVANWEYDRWDKDVTQGFYWDGPDDFPVIVRRKHGN